MKMGFFNPDKVSSGFDKDDVLINVLEPSMFKSAITF